MPASTSPAACYGDQTGLREGGGRPESRTFGRAHSSSKAKPVLSSPLSSISCSAIPTFSVSKKKSNANRWNPTTLQRRYPFSSSFSPDVSSRPHLPRVSIHTPRATLQTFTYLQNNPPPISANKMEEITRKSVNALSLSHFIDDIKQTTMDVQSEEEKNESTTTTTTTSTTTPFLQVSKPIPPGLFSSLGRTDPFNTTASDQHMTTLLSDGGSTHQKQVLFYHNKQEEEEEVKKKKKEIVPLSKRTLPPTSYVPLSNPILYSTSLPISPIKAVPFHYPSPSSSKKVLRVLSKNKRVPEQPPALSSLTTTEVHRHPSVQPKVVTDRPSFRVVGRLISTRWWSCTNVGKAFLVVAVVCLALWFTRHMMLFLDDSWPLPSRPSQPHHWSSRDGPLPTNEKPIPKTNDTTKDDPETDLSASHEMEEVFDAYTLDFLELMEEHH